jgi:hypothetical protein
MKKFRKDRSQCANLNSKHVQIPIFLKKISTFEEVYRKRASFQLHHNCQPLHLEPYKDFSTTQIDFSSEAVSIIEIIYVDCKLDAPKTQKELS